jgi:hypothetical protein
MKIYLDTEFTDLLGITVDIMLVSAGFVAEDGSEHYFELTNHWEEGGCSTFVCEAVLPHLDLKTYGKDPKDAIADLNAWIEGFGEPVTLCSDAPGYDWGLLYDLFTDYGFPANLVRRPLSVNTPESQRGIEEYFETQPYAKRDPENWDAHEMAYRPFAIRHHSLWDARALAYANGVRPLNLRVHCKMLEEAITDTVELPNNLLIKMISSIRDGKGTLDPERRAKDFGMLTDEEIAKIEAAYQKIDDFCKTENDGKTLVLRGYSVGLLSRYGAMKLLGFAEDEQLTEAMTAADIPLPDPANDRNSWVIASIVDACISSIIDAGTDEQKVNALNYPQLCWVLWDHKNKTISEEKAFYAYDKNFRFLDVERMDEGERAFFNKIMNKFGRGLKPRT